MAKIGHAVARVGQRLVMQWPELAKDWSCSGPSWPKIGHAVARVGQRLVMQRPELKNTHSGKMAHISISMCYCQNL